MKKFRRDFLTFCAGLLLAAWAALGVVGVAGMETVKTARAAQLSLGDLPIGSVIQIMGTDTGMCDNTNGSTTNCATQNAPVLPYKFVKMQARNADGTVKAGNSGFSDGGNYTYWMMMDNYCWWGSANCSYEGSRSSAYQAFNGISTGGSPAGYHNNLSLHLNNNILIPMDNFYNSLPAQIGGMDKAAAISTYAWEMTPMSSANPPVPGWGATYGTWTDGTYNPAGDANNQYVFSGGNAQPVMTSKIGLLSYTEWQGGQFAYGLYPSKPGGVATAPFKNTQNFSGSYQGGSGASFCLARWGTSNCAVAFENCSYGNNGDSYYCNVFNPDTSYSGVANLAYPKDNGTTGYLQLQGSANPRVRHPWLRSANSGSGARAWYVDAYGAGYSLVAGVAYGDRGVSPVLWLKSEVLVDGGEGSYGIPYCLGGGYCPGSESVVSITAPTDGGAVGVGTNIVMTGKANGGDIYDGDDQNGTGLTHATETTVSADICNVAGQCVNKSATVPLNSRNDLADWTLSWSSDELAAGTYSGTVVVKNSGGGMAESGTVNFTIAAKELAIKVVKDEAFNIKLGDANVINLAGCTLPYTQNGITISNTGGVLYAGNSGAGIAADATASCGGTEISAKVVTPANPSVSEVSLF